MHAYVCVGGLRGGGGCKEALSDEYPQHMFLLRNKNNITTFFWLKLVPYLELCILLYVSGPRCSKHH